MSEEIKNQENIKVCADCRLILAKNNFSDSKDFKDGKKCTCRECDKLHRYKKTSDYIINIEEKNLSICFRCKEIKSISDFYGNNKLKSGIDFICKDCFDNLEENVLLKQGVKRCSECNEIKSLDQFQFRKDNNKYRNECKSCRKKYNYKYGKLYRVREKDKLKKKSHAHWEKNKKEIYRKRRIYIENNRDKVNESRNRTRNKAKQKDEKYRLMDSLRNRFSPYFKGRGKAEYLLEHLKYTFENFKEFMQSDFRRIQEGYTFDDYLQGKLTLDHIIPLSAFEISIEGFLEANQLKNLRLITRSKNSSKKNKIDMRLIREFNLEDFYNEVADKQLKIF